MLHQFIKGKVYVFIDAENVFYAQRTLGWKISYEKLLGYFKRECGDDVKCFIWNNKKSGAARKGTPECYHGTSITRRLILSSLPVDNSIMLGY